MRVLQTGDHFTATTKISGTKEYEFLGVAIDTTTGCDYIRIRNVETNEVIGVEHLWFREDITHRKIELKEN